MSVLCIHQTRGQLRFLKRYGAGPDIQIEVGRRLAGFAGDEQDTVYVALTAKYESFLPFFTGLEIKTKASAPYLY